MNEKKRKITVTLTETVIDDLKILAIKEKTSVSAILDALAKSYLSTKTN